MMRHRSYSGDIDYTHTRQIDTAADPDRSQQMRHHHLLLPLTSPDLEALIGDYHYPVHRPGNNSLYLDEWQQNKIVLFSSQYFDHVWSFLHRLCNECHRRRQTSV